MRTIEIPHRPLTRHIDMPTKDSSCVLAASIADPFFHSLKPLVAFLYGLGLRISKVQHIGVIGNEIDPLIDRRNVHGVHQVRHGWLC